MDWERTWPKLNKRKKSESSSNDEETFHFKVHDDDVHSLLVELSRDGKKVLLRRRKLSRLLSSFLLIWHMDNYSSRT